MPRCASSERMRCGPWPLATRERTNTSVKRASASAPDCSSSSSTGPTTSAGKPRVPSLRVSSRRLCSRRASNSRAVRLHAGASAMPPAGSGFERLILLLGDHRRLGQSLLGRRQELGTNALFDLGRNVLVLDQEVTGVFLALPDPVAVEAVPRTGLLDDVLLDAEVHDL